MASLQNEYKGYVDLIIQEKDLLDKLNDCGKLKRQFIIKQKNAELTSIMQEELVLVRTIENTENKRLKLQEAISREDLPAMNSRQIRAYFKKEAPELVPDLDTAIKSLAASMRTLQTVNKKNQELLEISLDYIEDLKSLFGEKLTGTYSEQGTEVNLSDLRLLNKLLDKKI